MRHVLPILVLLLCPQLCERLGYSYTVMKPDRKSCYCADKLDKYDADTILNFSAKWFVPHATTPAEEDFDSE